MNLHCFISILLVNGIAIAVHAHDIISKAINQYLRGHTMIILSNVRLQALMIGAGVSIMIIIVIETNASLWLIPLTVIVASVRLSQLFRRWRA